MRCLNNNKEFAPVCRVDRNLYLIPLPQPIKGFNRFIGAWLVTGKRNILVDVGPSRSVEVLFSALDSLGIQKIDAIFLTHIHLDHAGGIGETVRHWPDAFVFCHARAIEHLAAPAALWQGSLRNIPDLAHVYGPVSPVPKDRLWDADKCFLSHIEVVETPGHASHHVSYCIDGNLFAGEAGGVCHSSAEGRFYMRPATPPTFFLETTLNSLDQLMHCQSNRLCYGHFGAAAFPSIMLQQHREQLMRWREIVAAEIKEYGSADLQAILRRLLRLDPMMIGWRSLGSAVQERESGFLISSIKGFVGDLCREDLITRRTH